jgi:hypothetical protein
MGGYTVKYVTEVEKATTSLKMKAMGVEKIPVIVRSDWEDEEKDN